MKVIKKSGKPFKSGEKINTVKGLVVNGKDPKKRALVGLLQTGVDSIDRADPSLADEPLEEAQDITA